MRLLWDYLSRYRGLVALALLLAAINQVFSLLDPLIFRHVIDQYATPYRNYTTGEFFRGVSLLLLPPSAWRSSRAWPRTSRITASA